MREFLPSFQSVLLSRFGALAPLEDSESGFLARLATRARDTRQAGVRLWSDVNADRVPSIIASGWACSARELKSGERQIIEILLPGDVIGFGGESRLAPAVTVAGLTQLRTIAAPELTTFWRERHLTPRMAARLESMLAEQHFLLTNHIARLGRAPAYGRIANLLAELHWRLTQREMADGPRFEMPLTQDQIADTVGLSVVHVNRTMQQLRREGKIAQEGRHLTLLDLEGVIAAGEFIPPQLAVV